MQAILMEWTTSPVLFAISSSRQVMIFEFSEPSVEDRIFL